MKRRDAFFDSDLSATLCHELLSSSVNQVRRGLLFLESDPPIVPLRIEASVLFTKRSPH